MTIEKDNFDALCNLSSLYLYGLGEIQNAVNYYDKCIELSSDEDELLKLYTERGYANTIRRSYEMANNDFILAESIYKDYFFLHFYRGHYYSQQNMNRKAIEEYKLALQTNPLHIGALKNLSGVLFDVGKYKECLHYVNIGIINNLDNFFFHSLKANVFYNTDNISGMESELKIIERIEGLNIEYQFEKANLYFKISKYDRSQTLFEELSLSEPKNGYLYFMIGRCHLNKGNISEARNYFINSYHLNWWDKYEIYLYLGICNYRLNNIKESKEWLEKAITELPEKYEVKHWMELCRRKESD